MRRSNLMPAISSSDDDENRSTRDAALIARIQAGDEDAFEDLYAAHALSLVRYATTVLEDQDAAEDVVQEVFMAIWKRRAEWNPRGTILAYIYRAVRNRVLDIQSHKHVVDRMVQATRHDPSAGLTSINRSPDLALELNEQQAALAQAIAALPERRRIALILRAIHGAEYSVIAETLGVTEQAARILVARARETLQEVWELHTRDEL